MNQESQFVLRFVVKDLAKMRKGVEEMNKNLQKMQKSAKGASAGIDNIGKACRKTAVSLTKFALAYFAVSKMVNTVFAKANERIELDLLAESAGVATDKVAKLGKALRVYGGDARTAGRAYASMTNIIGGAQHGMGVSQDVQRVNAMYGIAFNYGMISQEQLMTNIATTMQRLKKQGDQWGINQIASAYGLDSAMASFLAEQGANWSSKANRQRVEQLSKSETQRLIESQDTLKEEFFRLAKNVIPPLTEAMKLLNEGIQNLVAAINWIRDTFFSDKNLPKKTTNEKGEDIYQVPIRKYGMFGPKTEKMNILADKDKNGVAITNSAFDMGGFYKKWQDLQEKREKEAEVLKQQYENVPGVEYAYNKATGEERISFDLNVYGQNGATAEVKDIRSKATKSVNATVNGRTMPVHNVIGGY